MKNLLIVFSIILVLTGCGQAKGTVTGGSNELSKDQSNKDMLSNQEIVNALEGKGIALDSINNDNSIFVQELVKKKPDTYQSGMDKYYFYNYESNTKANEAVKEFNENTAAMKIKASELHVINNVMIIYVYDGQLKKEKSKYLLEVKQELELKN
ncbi:hypothetical protein GJU40_19820 [Bacillus lacus]|uniref:Lipoprotein n=1 Tax=Metabacillus lacus TaxID=1983721 RepID=A0A7X2J2P5_9BACI|nr:hypothetical protein [Metabacillus lacus]MRX74371.1 hypothetical protein [Metabacillus lacus]